MGNLLQIGAFCPRNVQLLGILWQHLLAHLDRQKGLEQTKSQLKAKLHLSKLISQSGHKSCDVPNSCGSTECPSEYVIYFHLPVRSMYVEEFTLHPWNSLNTHEGRGPLGDTSFSAFPRSNGIREYPLIFCGTGILAISTQRDTKSKCYCSCHDLKKPNIMLQVSEHKLNFSTKTCIPKYSPCRTQNPTNYKKKP